MIGERRILTGFSGFGVMCWRNGVFRDLYRGFCGMTESPELPAWLNFPRDERSSVDGTDDDFVLPTRLDGLEDQAGNWRAHHRGATAGIVSCTIAADADVDEISSILGTGFMSPEEVVRALGGCAVDVSKDLIDKMLKRFNNYWVPAFGFFRWVESTRPRYKHSADSFNTMVDILGKSKQFDAMWGLVEEMVRVGELVSLATMSKVMRRLAGAGRWNDVIEAFHKLEHFGVKKDTLAMNVLLDTLCKERSVMRARDVFFELRDKIPPDASSFNALIHGWCKARKLEEARWTMEEMRGSGFSPCVISYTCLIEAYCMEKNFRVVDAILDEMQANGCPPNVITYTIVMHSLGKAKEIQEALRIYEKMKSSSCAPDISFYNSLIYIIGSSGRLRDANSIYEEMSKNGISPNVTTYNTLISFACDHSQEQTALKLLLDMGRSFCNPDIKTYSPLLKLCCKRKRMKILYYLLGDMFKKDISLDLGTYSLLVHGLCKNGKLEQSCLFFEEMVLKGLVPRHHTFKMLTEQLESKKMGRANQKVQKLMAQAEIRTKEI